MTKNDPASYLESGTNELKILEFSAGGLHFGLNILKTSRVLNTPERLTSLVNAPPFLIGIMDNLGVTVPVIDLAKFLKLKEEKRKEKEPLKGRIIVTEFFGQVNGFFIERVHYVHTILWRKVFDSNEILGNLGSDYVIGIVRPDEKTNILLLDYEKIILELSPELKREELGKIPDDFQGNQRKVLIAEDSSAVRDMLTLELSERGFEVLSVKDGMEALEVFRNTPDLSLVISDVEMPQLEGLSLTKIIKEENPKMPVIVYSSIGDPGMKERAKAVNADFHVTKLNIDELIDSVRQLLKQ
ncbi:chemotaxis protein CheV [Deltaproteobacteria bacterium TL4]